MSYYAATGQLANNVATIHDTRDCEALANAVEIVAVDSVAVGVAGQGGRNGRGQRLPGDGFGLLSWYS